MRSDRWKDILAVGFLVLTPILANGSMLDRLTLEGNDLLSTCLAQKSSRWECLKNESLATINHLAYVPCINVLDGINLVRADILRSSGDAMANEQLAGTADDEAQRSAAQSWTNAVVGALRRLFHTHVLEIDLPNSMGPVFASQRQQQQHADQSPVLVIRFVGRPSSASYESWRVEGRHRRRQQMIPMMIFGVTVFGMFIVPIAFQFLTALSGKAFLMAKLALLLASINGLKRVASTGVHYGLYHAVDGYPTPHHGAAVPGHRVPFGPGPLLYDRAEAYAEGPRNGDLAL
ncbi:uncharacterized protein LOC131213227 [Anopheles bellator]|uniref:uncharacterized protein LOC131213227 n=1 Tax=Anopheles bellator TaxID=139047 RepID=UPI002647D053|nr:uncharacterized protein LOC131213227 [Anopheles bellator]